ncbi:lipoate-protein ligase A [Enterococcus moraviensis ATCC BAA-383]|uniref:Lipoyl-[GcvH]:protein N-lipoyltransferase n=1 Tax=Enterococcus moraviensis ATCC BAA-383 TaxID=1158609 RepID=R2QV49_9ENTE|nr:lipoate--protein ligase family protein [Enterococcus moraviensis]EOI00380.1 lipoate-protein ligase A [Enterococcus moraviensis ATCC BAA-383]EOT73391.1 lipoate-protein ligase A [Enterococcus moraviensis ATCC BAA-383]
MTNFNELFTNNTETVFLYDQHCLTEKDYYLPFALTDTLTTFAGINTQPIIHFWQLDQAMILGMKDTRVDDLKSGLNALKEDGYNSVIRNAGGLGVIADAGVLNVSLILPNEGNKKISIDEAYTYMWDWIKCAFEDTNHSINAFEVTESYCPGTFDLSINGKKFAGIAQRRVKDGTAIMIYLSVTGDQQRRGKSVRRFYETSLHENFGKNGYPPVNPSVMANLEDLLQKKMTINEVKKRLISVLLDNMSISIDEQIVPKLLTSDWFETEINKQTDKMHQRNLLLKQL